MAYVKFFVVGCPRSGTTLLQQALNRHTQVVIPPETAFFSLLGAIRRPRPDRLIRLNDDLGLVLTAPPIRLHQTAAVRTFYEEMARQYVGRVGKPGVTHFGDKTPEHLRRLSRIRRVFPDARVVCIYRDGRDVALSLRQLPFTSRDLYVNFAMWLHCCRLQRRARRSAGLPLLFVRYEDLVSDPERKLRAVLDFLGLPYQPQVVEGEGNAVGVPDWEYQWKGRAIEKIRPDRVGLWQRELSADEVGVLERWGGWALREWGYELTTDGRRPLPRFFRLRVAWKSAVWLVRRPPHGRHKAIWLARQQASTGGPVPGTGPAEARTGLREVRS